MKLALLLATLALSSTARAASPADACRDFGTFRPNLGVECLSMVSKAKIQDDALAACKAAGQFQPEQGVACLRETLNKRYDAAAVKSCTAFTTFQPTMLAPCFKTIEAKAYSNDEIQMCNSNGQFNPGAGVSCLEKLGKKDEIFGCPTNEALLKAVRNVRTNLKVESIDFTQSMLAVMDQVMRQIDRAAMAEKTLAAIEFALQTCQK